MAWINLMGEIVYMDKSYLGKLRKEIDKVDYEISLLLQKRMDLVTEVVEYKSCYQAEVLDANREEKVIENVLSRIDKTQYSETIESVYKSIMESSREYQMKQLKKSSKPPKSYAVIGEKLSHSLSSKIHGLFFRKTGLDAIYEIIEVPSSKLKTILTQLKKNGLSGVNVTIPYKTDIMESLDYISPIAQRIGAVNTIDIGESFKGFNTDYYGFGKALSHYGFEIENKVCAILGSGGSARAVITYLEDNKASEIAVISRNTNAAALKFPGKSVIPINEFSANGFDLIVNTTPVGMYPNEGVAPIGKNQLKGASFVMDLIYNPNETLLLKYARELGIPCANGLYMLVAQAIGAEEIWQGSSYEEYINKSSQMSAMSIDEGSVWEKVNVITNEIYEEIKDSI